MKNIYQLVTVIFIFVLLVLGCGGRSEEEIRQQKADKEQEQAREVIAKQLSDKFDSTPDCIFRFQALGTQSKRLLIKNCSPTTGLIEPEKVLTIGDRTKLKNLGFEEVKVTSWESAFKSYTSIYKFNNDASLEFVKYE